MTINTATKNIADIQAVSFGKAVELKNADALQGAVTLSDVSLSIRFRDGAREITLASAFQLMAELEAAVDYARNANPELFAEGQYTPAQRQLIVDALRWARAMVGAGRTLDFITDESIERSSLLKRIRSGKQPMDLPPPTSFGQPWYEILESPTDRAHVVDCDGRISTLAELLGTQDLSSTVRAQMIVKINGCPWDIVRIVHFGSVFLVRYGQHPQRFLLSRMESAPVGTPGWSLRRLDDDARYYVK
jgi:hypothetical protein